MDGLGSIYLLLPALLDLVVSFMLSLSVSHVTNLIQIVLVQTNTAHILITPVVAHDYKTCSTCGVLVPHAFWPVAVNML